MSKKGWKRKKKGGRRLFLCILPSKEVRDVARDLRREFKSQEYKLSFLPLEQIHLTVKFLGDNVSDKSSEFVQYTLDKYLRHFDSFRITTNDAVFGLSSQTKPRIMYLDVEETSELNDLKNLVNQRLRELSLPDVIKKKDRKNFTSHITIARVKKDISNSFIGEVDQILSKFGKTEVTMKVDNLYLISSTLTNTGPVYEIIASFPLRDR